MVDQLAMAHDSDVETLHRMGYAQELRRRMSGFSNFAVSFTIISILSGCLTAYGVAMNNGGPVDMNIGWPLVRDHGAHGRARNGRGLLETTRPPGSVLLVGQARWQAWSSVELVHRLVQPARPGGGHRRDRRRPGPVRVGIPQQLVRLHAGRTAHSSGLRGRTLPARPAEHIRGAVGCNPQQHLGVVAHPPLSS